MADAFDLVQNGFPVKHVALGDSDVKAETLMDDAFQDLGLHFAHQRHLDLLKPGIPGDF